MSELDPPLEPSPLGLSPLGLSPHGREVEWAIEVSGLHGPVALDAERARERGAWWELREAPHEGPALFELEALLRGLRGLGDTDGLDGLDALDGPAETDRRGTLRLLREGAERCVLLIRVHLEVEADPLEPTPEGALQALDEALSDLAVVAEGLAHLGRVPEPLFLALHRSLLRELEHNLFFPPAFELELRGEVDRLPSEEETAALAPAELGRLTALALSLLDRARRMLLLAEGHVDRSAETSAEGRGEGAIAALLLVALRADLRALTELLGGSAGELLASGLEREIFALHASEIDEEGAGIEALARSLTTARRAFESAANALLLDLRHALLLPTRAEAEAPPSERRRRLLEATLALRAAVESAARGLRRELLPADPSPSLPAPLAQACAERDRREVWMFQQIVRAFVAKARAYQAPAASWSRAASLRFVQDFSAHFRAMGYGLLRARRYPRLDALLRKLEGLRRSDVPQEEALRKAANECEALLSFLAALGEELDRSPLLSGRAFDRREATEALRLYIGR